MKRNLIFAVCSALALTACSKEALLPKPTTPQTKTATALTVENGMLKFANEAAIDSTLSMLLQKNEQELAAWYDSTGFVSQELAREAALEEFRAMESLEEYPAFKAKYQGQFLFNDNLEEEDFQPYVAASRFAYELILDAEGNAIVDGQVKNYNFDRFEQTMYYRVAHESSVSADSNSLTKITPETKKNQVYGIVGKKKFWAWAVRMGTDLYIQVTAQKKNIFGWNDYKTEYCITLRQILSAAAMSQNVLLGAAYAFKGYGRNQPYWTAKTSCNTRFLIHRTKNVGHLVTGAYAAYTTGTGADGEGVLVIEL